MIRRPIAAAAGMAAVALAVAGAPQPTARPSGPTPSERAAAAVNGPSLSSLINLEAVPAVSRADAVALAAGSTADQAAFGFRALEAARALPATRARWQQVGAGEGFVEDGDRGAIDTGRLKNTGITLSLAADLRDATGGTIYIGSGGGLWKTTDTGKTIRRLDLPAVPIGGVGVDPSNPDIVVAATGQAFQGGGEGGASGAYVSRDAGRTWTRPEANVSGNGGQQVSIGPDGSIFVATDRGLWRSTDHGDTFTDVRLPTNADGTAPAPNTPVGSWTSDVQIRPGHPSEVYAAVGYVAGNVELPDGTPAAPGNGLYRSTEGGAPGTFRRVDVTRPGPLGWNQNPTGSDDPIGRTRLAFTPNGEALFALVADAGLRGGRTVADEALPLGVGSNTSLNGVYLTLNPGAADPLWALEVTSETLTAAPGSFQPILSAFSALGYQPGIQAWYNGWIQVDPGNPSRVFLGEEETYVSLVDPTLPGPSPFKVIDRYFSQCSLTSGGACEDGTPVFGGVSTHPDQHEGLLLKIGSSTRLWSGNDGGTFYQDEHPTTDLSGFDNEHWRSIASYNTLLPYRAVKGSDGSVIAGTQDNGTIKWTKGDPVGLAICGGDGTGVATAPSRPEVFYCQENGSLSVTTDGGKTLSGTGAPAAPAFQPGAFTMDPVDEDHLMIADSTVYETTRGASSTSGDWKGVFDTPNGETIEAVDTYGGTSYAAYCLQCSNSVRAGIEALDRHLATNVKAGCEPAAGSGECWHEASLKGMPKREIVSLAIDPADPRSVYLATVAPSVVKVDFGDPARVVLSTDAGETVRDVSGNLPLGNVYDIKVAGDNVYAAHDQGVFTARKGSSDWSRAGSNLPTGRVYGLSISADRTELVAATYGSGVWTQKLPAKAALPPKPGASGPVKGRLAATGGSTLLAGTALLALLGAVVLRRRLRH